MKPQLHSAKVFGVRPGNPVLYRLAASGAKPMRYHADPLPEGLRLDASTGMLEGRLEQPGEHRIRLAAENAHGCAEQELRLVVGKEICLTPPLGWNSWNCWGAEVSQERVLDAAKAMVDSGLADYGWSYVNIDDCWQGRRVAGGALQPNERFPDMAGLCREIHAMGLKVGLYSTPWYGSYTGNPGGSAHTATGEDWTPPASRDRADTAPRHYHAPYKFDYPDVEQWVQWGIDYLKYDWAPIDLDSTHRMRQALMHAGRDIVFALSNNCPEYLAGDILHYAHAVRTTADLHDLWETGARPGTSDLHGIRDVWRRHHRWQPHTRPGHYADPDMLVVGQVGWGSLRPTRLTPDEQRTHLNLWCLWAAPLLIGCPLDSLDPFTLSLLTQADLLDIQKDPLGIQGKPLQAGADGEVIAKPLEDGGMAVGFFNLAHEAAAVEVDLTPWLGEQPRLARDVWTGEETEWRGSQAAWLPAHGSQVWRLEPHG